MRVAIPGAVPHALQQVVLGRRDQARERTGRFASLEIGRVEVAALGVGDDRHSLGVGRGIAGVFGGGGPPSLTKQVLIPGPPALVPPGRRVYAVGDVHGRADLLVRLLKDLHEDIGRGGFEGRPILVMLGDYIDRGFQSKDVIDVLMGELMSPFETYFLKGNHEAAMLQFLTDPTIGPRWSEFGGAETLVSYGVRPPRTRTSAESAARR